MTQELDWNHLLDTAVYLRDRLSFPIAKIVPCDLNAKITVPSRAECEDLSNIDFTIEPNGAIDSIPASSEWSYITFQRRVQRQSLDDAKVDCKYYSDNPLLFCAVNIKCEECIDYCPRAESDRYE